MSPSKLTSRTSGVLAGAIRPVSVKDMSSTCDSPSSEQTSSSQKTINMQNLNPNIIKLQYAVRGPLVIRAAAIKKELEEGKKKPFSKVVSANIGDAQAMGQKPISFIRQVLACVIYPELIKNSCYLDDVKERATGLLKNCNGGSAGAYTESNGLDIIRKHAAEYIERRDGHKSNWQDIVITAGATTGIKSCLQMLGNKVDGKGTGVMIPIPQYPLYSASLAEYGLGQVGYYLDEERNWSLDDTELERAFKDGSKENAVRGLVVINPGNPTGQVLTLENMQRVLMFAAKHKLFVLADEVYQDNVYAKDSKFSSFKKDTLEVCPAWAEHRRVLVAAIGGGDLSRPALVQAMVRSEREWDAVTSFCEAVMLAKKVMTEMGPPYSELEMASFMSASKGYMGECGLRAGWMELMNLDKEVQAKPPRCEEPSYKQWCEERAAVQQSLKKRASMIVDTFNNMEGFKCNVVQGALYAFPRIDIPAKAVEAAKAAKIPADAFYAFKLLEETGICIVPGSGFGQRPGTYHFRTTILPQPKDLEQMLEMFKVFHEKFTKEFS